MKFPDVKTMDPYNESKGSVRVGDRLMVTIMVRVDVGVFVKHSKLLGSD